MGQRLYGVDPHFRAALDRCAELCKPLGEEDLLDTIFEPSNANKLNGTFHSSMAIFSVEYALAEMWRERGVKPYAVLGHSVGEYVAAVVAGTV
eukprot:14721853-Heterocapsa_arctica.AAC.1